MSNTMTNTSITLAYGLNDDETRDAVRETVAGYNGDVRRAAYDYTEANPNARLVDIEDAIWALLPTDRPAPPPNIEQGIDWSRPPPQSGDIGGNPIDNA